MSFESLPPASEESLHPFEVGDRTLARIALALAAYVLCILYPAYGLLRWLWTGELTVFSWPSFGIALLVAMAFGLFARRTMAGYMRAARRSSTTSGSV